MAQNNFTATGFQSWENASNWSLGHIPLNSEDTFIGTTGVIVGVSANVTVDSIGTGTSGDVLFIDTASTFVATLGTGPTAGNLGTIDINDGATFEVATGSFVNTGTVELESAGDNTNFLIGAGGFVTLSGGGSIELVNNGGTKNFIAGQSHSDLINENNDISGSGTIFGEFFTNDGIIETNNNLGAGTLNIWGNGAGGGSFDNEGSMFVDPGGTMVLGIFTANIANDNLIELTGTGSNEAKLEIQGNLTISSVGGFIDLAGPDPNNDAVVSNGSAATLNLDGGTLEGGGEVGNSDLTLEVEQGTVINANSSFALILNTGNNAIENAGLIEAAGSGGLEIASPVQNNGTISSVGSVILTDALFTGTGTINLGLNGTLLTVAGADIINNVQFTGAGALLSLAALGNLEGTIVGAAATDKIDLQYVTFVSGEHVVWQQTTGAFGALSLYSDGVDLGNVVLDGQYNSLDFAVTKDSGTGSLVTVQNTPTYAENPGNTDEWILSDGNWVASAGPGPGPTDASGNPYQVAGTGNWTGKGTDGILWFDPSTGDVNEWQLSNTQWAAGPDLGTHPANSTDGASYQIAGTDASTDFTGNGRDDVLWTSTNGNGTIATDIWELGSNGKWSASVSPGNHPAGYSVAGTGDWTGDGTDGILWHNASTGDTDEWQLSGGMWSASVDLGSHPANSTDGNAYQIAGIGDFFDNGRDDVLWTSVNANGTVATDIWELNSSGQWMASVSPGNHPAGYSVVGVADFTGTGTSDILWQNSTTGAIDEWQIAGGNWAASVNLGTHPGNTPVSGVGDFTGTGTSDIFFHS